MTITTKVLDIDEEATEQQIAERRGYYMNLLGGCRYDPMDHKYKMAPIKYSDVPLEGEKIKFANGQEFVVTYSCLASDYSTKKAIYDMWWKETQKIIDAYKEQEQLKAHIATNNIDLKRLRSEGKLLDKEDFE